MSAADTIGLVIDAISKMVSVVIGVSASLSRQPCASRCTTSPRRATSVTAPAICFVSMYSRMYVLIRCRRSDDMPTDSGATRVGSSAACRLPAGSVQTAAATNSAAANSDRRNGRCSLNIVISLAVTARSPVPHFVAPQIRQRVIAVHAVARLVGFAVEASRPE